MAASAPGYASDLKLVYPTGSGVFEAGGDIAFHHGGPSLQELIIPDFTVRAKLREVAQPSVDPITASGLPATATNRMFSVTLQLGGRNLPHFSSKMLIRPLLMSAKEQVGAVEMAADTELDRATGCVKIETRRPITVVFLLSDESVSSLRVVVQDPTTDAEPDRSPPEIPVRLGI